jgi:hypothetical protein
MKMLPLALLLLAAACDQEPGSASGDKVAILFEATTNDYEGIDEAVRSAAATEPATEMVSLADGLYLYATLKPEPAELRAYVPPKEGQKVRFSAHNTAGTQVATAQYTYTGGKLVADNQAPFLVEPGRYTFTAYSYYESSETPSAGNIQPAKDLMWGPQVKDVKDNDRSVTIQMKHLFSKVRVVVNTTVPGAKITALGNVKITTNSANLSVPDGKLSKGANVELPVAFPSFSPTDAIGSTGTPLVYPEDLRVNIASISMSVSGRADPVTLTNLSLRYKNLVGGNRYALEVSVQRSRWAFSNIYWVTTGTNTGYLTFDVENKGHQGYQGVFFRWGSLVGISPALTDGANDAGKRYNENTPVYVPTYNIGDAHASTWSRKSGSSGESKNTFTCNDFQAGSRAPEKDIPYLDGSCDPDTSYDNTYAMDAGQNTDKRYTDLQGDICQYLGKTNPALSGYRLPKRSEFNAEYRKWDTPSEDGWIKGEGIFTSDGSEDDGVPAGYADGRADLFATRQGSAYNAARPTNGQGIKYGAAINQKMGVVFPLPGVRIFTSYNVALTGYDGYHWSCSAGDKGIVWTLAFTNSYMGNFYSGRFRSEAVAVRCIRKLPGEP